MSKQPRHFINLDEIPADTLKAILKNAHELKKQKFNPPQIFKGLSLALVFDKLSTRTRFSFDVAMQQLGGHTITSTMGEMQIGGKESIESTAKVLSRYVDAVMIRMSSEKDMKELARHASIPIINGMTNESHPCQIMADIMTVEEKMGTIKGKKVAWFGDYNNVAKTYVKASKIWNFDLVLACPKDVQDGSANFETDALSAAQNADIIVTDTWISLGEEGKNADKFKPYQVNSDIMNAANDGAIFLHCLPIAEWYEVTEDVAKSPASVIYDEAENRLHAQKAILAWCLEEAGVAV